MGQLVAKAALQAVCVAGFLYTLGKAGQYLDERSRKAANKK